jgi:hypothetical protein
LVYDETIALGVAQSVVVSATSGSNADKAPEGGFRAITICPQKAEIGNHHSPFFKIGCGSGASRIG